MYMLLKICFRLPLPSIITRSSSDGEVHIDDPNEHDGRTRSFPHERGNWATYLYIPCMLLIWLGLD